MEPSRIRQQLDLERRLATMLMGASAEDRPRLYREAYDQLYRTFPELQREDEERVRRVVRSGLAFLRPFLGPDRIFLEIGPGRCHFLHAVAPHVKRALGADIAALGAEQPLPANVEHVLLAGTALPLPDGSVDLAYSHQVIEHLHPDDVAAHLAEVRRVLRRGGRYALVTPSRLTGPHDVSAGFSDVADGLHLKEYTTAELSALLNAVGFASVVPWVGGRGRYRPLPLGAVAAVERLVPHLPRGWRASLPVRGLVGVRIVAEA